MSERPARSSSERPLGPKAVIIAGPNGSGKSTAATRLLPPGMPFVNADNIAQELTGKRGTPADINAGRILLERVERLEHDRTDFGFETTLATKMLAKRVAGWRDRGYRIFLLFVWLPSDDMAVLRVQGRVRDGGHDVPEATIRRRYQAGLRNFFRLYSPVVDTWRVYDNSRDEGPILIARGGLDGTMKIGDPEIWSALEENYRGETNA